MKLRLLLRSVTGWNWSEGSNTVSGEQANWFADDKTLTNSALACVVIVYGHEQVLTIVAVETMPNNLNLQGICQRRVSNT